MIFGGPGTKIAPIGRGDRQGSGPSGIPGYYIIMWNGFAVFFEGARIVKAVEA